MKKVCAVLMVLCLLLTGCSGVSQEEYDNLAAKNQELLEQKENLNENVNTLTSKNETLENKLKDTNTELYKVKKELERLKEIEEAAKKEQEYIEAMKEYSLDYVNSNNEGRIYSYCGNLWYKSESGSYVTFVESNSAVSDDDMVNYAYADAVGILYDAVASGKMLYTFVWQKQDGGQVGMLLINVMQIGGKYTLVSDGILWSGEEYSHLNDNSNNDKSDLFTPTSAILN